MAKALYVLCNVRTLTLAVYLESTKTRATMNRATDDRGLIVNINRLKAARHSLSRSLSESLAAAWNT